MWAGRSWGGRGVGGVAGAPLGGPKSTVQGAKNRVQGAKSTVQAAKGAGGLVLHLPMTLINVARNAAPRHLAPLGLAASRPLGDRGGDFSLILAKPARANSQASPGIDG